MDGNVVRDSATDDTKVRTAVSWLEEAKLLSREENQVSLFPSSLRINRICEARDRLAKSEMTTAYRQQLLAVTEILLNADPDEGVTTDELMAQSGLTSEGVRKALYDLERLGISSNDTVLTAFVHVGVERSSLKRFESAMALEKALIARLQVEAPDLTRGDTSALHLRHTTQALINEGIDGALPESIRRILKSLGRDGRGEDSGKGSLRLSRLGSDSLKVTLLRDWEALSRTAELRLKAARLILEHLVACLPQGQRGAMTCHALAMRLTGHSFAGDRQKLDENSFQKVLKDAAALLKGEGLAPEEADEQRDRLLAGFRWILVDEYQDIEADQYNLISGLAGRTQQDEEGRLSLFAVGDDDQNIYSFAGASVEYIRKFEADYSARSVLLAENYRSTEHIISAANLLIEPAHNRMKIGSPIRIDRKREREPAGGLLEKLDPVSSGRVQILPVGNDPITQAVAVMRELQRLSLIVPDWSWCRTAVIARNWDTLDPVRSYCELHEIPVQSAAEDNGSVWRLRETQALVAYLSADPRRLIDAGSIRRWLDEQPDGVYWLLLRKAADEYALEAGDQELPVKHCIEWFAEWARDVKRKQTGLLLLSAHRAKGLEFDHVAILDGNWAGNGHGEDSDAPCRLYYVAMTRARHALVLARKENLNPLLTSLPEDPCLLERSVEAPMPYTSGLVRKYLRLRLADVDLSFAGRQVRAGRVHAALARLVPGSPLNLRPNGRKLELRDSDDQVVGRLAKAFRSPTGMRCISAKVDSVFVRFAEDSDPRYRDRVRTDQWEVVVPELVYEP